MDGDAQEQGCQLPAQGRQLHPPQVIVQAEHEVGVGGEAADLLLQQRVHLVPGGDERGSVLVELGHEAGDKAGARRAQAQPHQVGDGAARLLTPVLDDPAAELRLRLQAQLLVRGDARRVLDPHRPELVVVGLLPEQWLRIHDILG